MSLPILLIPFRFTFTTTTTPPLPSQPLIAAMGSLPSPPLPPPPRQNSTDNFRVYASFCRRKPTATTSMTWLESYNPSENAWHQVGNIPGLADNHVLKGFALVALGNCIYIIGGRLCHKEDPIDDTSTNGTAEVDLAILPSVLCYSVNTQEWSHCAPLGTPRFDFACSVCEGKIYVAGGQSTLSSARGVSSAEVYDPELGQWTPLPNMSTLRYKCVGVTWQGKIHVVGGFAEREDSDRTILFVTERSSVEVFDPWRGVWDLIEGMWQLDVPPNQIVDVGDRLFSSGDCLNPWKGHIEAYDGKLNIWNIVDGSHLQNLSCPVSSTSAAIEASGHPVQRLYLTMAPIGTYLYFLAGYRLPGELLRSMAVVHAFDTSATQDAWRRFRPMEEDGEKELCSHCCVVQVQ